jgi:8-oxo-dGTP pyrophosphatase MutT (NUDIX family)
MPLSAYLRELRAQIGTQRLMLPGVAAIVRDADGRVLLQRRTDDGGWSLPGGSVDPGEEPAQAVAREVWEETGLLVRPTCVSAVLGGERFRHTYPNGDQVEMHIVLFECRTEGGELGGLDDETAELRYFAPEAMPPVGLPYTRELFAQAAAGTAAHFAWDDAWLEEMRRMPRNNATEAAGRLPGG